MISLLTRNQNLICLSLVITKLSNHCTVLRFALPPRPVVFSRKLVFSICFNHVYCLSSAVSLAIFTRGYFTVDCAASVFPSWSNGIVSLIGSPVFYCLSAEKTVETLIISCRKILADMRPNAVNEICVSINSICDHCQLWLMITILVIFLLPILSKKSNIVTVFQVTTQALLVRSM